MVRARKLVHYDFGLQLQNTPNWTRKRLRSWSSGLSCRIQSGKKKIENSSLKSSKLRMVTQNASHNLAKISSKSIIVCVHYIIINHECRPKFVFCKILNEVRPVELRGGAFPALFRSMVWVGLSCGFHKNRNSPWRPGLGFRPVSSSCSLFKKTEKVISKAVERRPQKTAC